MMKTAPRIATLTSTDWNDEWIRLQEARRHSDNADHWDARAQSYQRAMVPSPYTKQFLEYAHILPHETVLDMGCGTGAIALPVAAMNHDVIAADFSARMLEILDEQRERAGITTLTTQLLSWEDDWNACGLGENSVDVACASRSIATSNLKDALVKMTNVARRRACITLPTGSSPRIDERIMSALGLQDQLGRDFVYAFMILVNDGYKPEVRYIASERLDTYDTVNEAYASLAKMVEDVAASHDLISDEDVQRAYERLHVWVADNVVKNDHVGAPDDHGGVQKAYKLKTARRVTWSFLAWDTSSVTGCHSVAD